MKLELDSETQKVLSEGERIENFVKGDDWAWIKGMIMEKLSILDRTSTIVPDGRSWEQIGQEAMTRASVSNILLELIDEVEAKARQSQMNREALFVDDKDAVIKRY